MRASREKIIARPELARLGETLRAAGKRVVLANRCFDLLHVVHVRSLGGAGAEGDALVVGVNADRSLARLKGPGRPILGERARALLVAALGVVDHVVIFDEANVEALLHELR